MPFVQEVLPNCHSYTHYIHIDKTSWTHSLIYAFYVFLYNFFVCDKCINRDLYFYNKYTFMQMQKIFIHFY